MASRHLMSRTALTPYRSIKQRVPSMASNSCPSPSLATSRPVHPSSRRSSSTVDLDAIDGTRPADLDAIDGTRRQNEVGVGHRPPPHVVEATSKPAAPHDPISSPPGPISSCHPTSRFCPKTGKIRVGPRATTYEYICMPMFVNGKVTPSAPSQSPRLHPPASPSR
jgi:hypothetical protein